MNEKYKQNFLRAGSIAKEVRAFGKSLIHKGASYNFVITEIRRKIAALGAIPAFPPQIALDNVAAHFLLQPNQDLFFSHEVVKLDVGVCYEGAIGDCAVTVDLSGKNQALVDAAEAALLAAEQIIRVGLEISQIGKVIEDTILARGFTPIRNLAGHGLGLYQVHKSPTIPNYHDRSRGIIKPGMTFAIEPFATTGKGMIYEEGIPAIFSLVSPKSPRSPLLQKVLTKIKTFSGLPFSTHDLTAEFPLNEVMQALGELLHKGIIAGYPPLLEQGGGLVAQAENSILVDQNGVVVVTTR